MLRRLLNCFRNGKIYNICLVDSCFILTYLGVRCVLMLFLCISLLSFNHVIDVFNKVVLANVIRKIKGDTQDFSLYLFSKFMFC